MGSDLQDVSLSAMLAERKRGEASEWAAHNCCGFEYSWTYRLYLVYWWGRSLWHICPRVMLTGNGNSHHPSWYGEDIKCISCCVALPSRSDHLYVFFMQWSPDMYGEGVRGMEQEPGFMVVKKNEVSESAEDEPITDLNVKEWEVGSSVRSSCYCSALLSHLSWIKYSPHYGLIHYCISNMSRFKSVLICENAYCCVDLLSLCSTYCNPSQLCSCQTMLCICALPCTAAYTVSPYADTFPSSV